MVHIKKKPVQSTIKRLEVLWFTLSLISFITLELMTVIKTNPRNDEATDYINKKSCDYRLFTQVLTDVLRQHATVMSWPQFFW